MSKKDKLPESISPEGEQKTFERLTMNDVDYDNLQFIRRHMSYIFQEKIKDNQIKTENTKDTSNVKDN